MKQLTVKEAIEQGYESYFYNSDGWQGMKYLNDILLDPTSIDWGRDDIYICSKEATQSISLSEGELKDLLVDHFECQYYDVTHDDDSLNTINDAFGKLDLKPFEDAIEKVLEDISSYTSTDIKLIP